MSGGSAAVAPSAGSVDSKYLPTSTPSYVVGSFLKHIQPRALRGGAKEWVTAFAKWYFSRRPVLAASDVRLLLLGDEDRRGVMESCGNSKGLSAALGQQGGGGGDKLRSSAVLCVELLLMLLDSNVNTEHADAFIDALVAAHSGGQLSARLLASMRLSQHIDRAAAAANDTQLEYAYKLLFILESAVPALKGKEWVGSAEVVRRYEQWQRARLAALEEQQRAARDEEDEDRVLSSWADVKLADLEAEEGQAEAALAELIADVDAEAEAEGGQKDPLGILQKPIAASSAGKPKQQAAGQQADIRTPARLGGAAAAQMKALWRHVSSNGATQQKTDSTERREETGAGSSAEAGGELLHDVLSAARLAGSGSGSGGGDSISADSAQFSPVLFLSSVHSQTPLDALQRGVAHLQRSVNNRAAALKALVADHYGQYVFCLNTIEHLEQLMAAEVSDKGSSRAQRLRHQLDQLNQQCAEAYDAIIQQKAGGERMRRTLATMTQYRFLFALPGEVAQYAATRQLAQVVRAYKKAKGINLGAVADDGRRGEKENDSRASKQHQQQQQSGGELSSLVLAEVFRVISSVRASLFRQLESAGVPVDEQAEAIAYLRELDADIDPAWYFLHRQTANCSQHIKEEVVTFIVQVHSARTQRIERLIRQHSEQLLDSSPQQQQQHHLPVASDGSAASHSFSIVSSQLATLPWNRFGFALLCNPVWIASLPVPPVYATEWPTLLPTAVLPSTAVDELSAALLPALVDRLSQIVSSGVPNLLKLARLTAVAQHSLAPPSAAKSASLSSSASSSSSSSSSITHALPASLSPAAAVGAAAGQSVVSLLSSMDDSSRRGVESLLHSVLHHFAVYIRLLIFPLSAQAARQWPVGTFSPSSAELTVTPSASPPAGRQPSAIAAPSSAGSSLPSPTVASPQSVSAARQSVAVLDKSSEHRPFSPASSSVADHTLPSIQPPEVCDKLPLPASLATIVVRLLQLHSQLMDSQLPSSVLAPLTDLRKDLVRSYAQQHVKNLQTDVRQIADLEDWQLAAHSHTHASTATHNRYSQQSPSTAGAAAMARPRCASKRSSGSNAADCSSLRITGLPSRFAALFASTVSSLSAIPSFKPVWLIKLVAGPMMDAMRAFAAAEQTSATQCAQRQQSDQEQNSGVPASLQLLLVLANVRYTRLQLLPGLLAALLAVFPITTHSLLQAAYQQSVLPAYEEAETAALHLFIRLQLARLHHHMAQRAYSSQALMEHVNAHATRAVPGSRAAARPLPSIRTRGCVVAACLQLVAVHAQVFLVAGHAADEVTTRVMQAMLAGAMESIHIALQQQQRDEQEAEADAEYASVVGGAEVADRPPLWSAHGAVLLPLVSLEAEFIHSALSTFSSETSRAAKRSVDDLLSAWQRRYQSAEGDAAADLREADTLSTRKQLKADMARTQLMFAAFQQPASDSAQAALSNGHSSGNADTGGSSSGHTHVTRGSQRIGQRQTDEEQSEPDSDDAVLDDDEEEEEEKDEGVQ